MAQFSKATRFLAPVLVKILLTWLSTVRLLIVRTWAISWLVRPRATSSTISVSRSEMAGSRLSYARSIPHPAGLGSL